MKLTEVEALELEKIIDEIISKGGSNKGQIKVNSDPALVARYNELADKLAAPENDQSETTTANPAPEPTKDDQSEEKKPVSKVDARRILLEARLRNPGSKYSLAQRQTWRRELKMIADGTWTRELAPKNNKGIYKEVVG